MTQKFHDLVAGARSYRRFDQSKKMTMQELEKLAELGRITPCGGNRQYIRFALCADEKMNAEIYKNLAWAGYLSDWDGPVEGERPTGYILILRDLSLQKNQTVDDDPDPSTMLSMKNSTGILTSFLEQSSTDLATEFANMIVYQRGYQANTRIVTVTDSMLEELVNIKR